MAISNNFQFEYTNPRGDSILMGALTDYDVTDVRGLGMPSVRANDVGRLDADGSIMTHRAPYHFNGQWAMVAQLPQRTQDLLRPT